MSKVKPAPAFLTQLKSALVDGLSVSKIKAVVQAEPACLSEPAFVKPTCVYPSRLL